MRNTFFIGFIGLPIMPFPSFPSFGIRARVLRFTTRKKDTAGRGCTAFNPLARRDTELFAFRPFLGWAQFRTPIEGLYLCGSGTHPGGGITGAAGANASREIIKDLKSRR